MTRRHRTFSAAMGRGSFLPALLIVGVGATALIASSSPPAQPDGSAQALLRQKMGFSTAEVQALDAGHAVIRTLETPVRQEIAHVGVCSSAFATSSASSGAPASRRLGTSAARHRSRISPRSPCRPPT